MNKNYSLLASALVTVLFASGTAAQNRDRNAYFGDLHVHTKLSFDAYIFGEDPVAHIPVALQGLLGKLDPELRARLKQQLRLTYLKS